MSPAHPLRPLPQHLAHVLTATQGSVAALLSGQEGIWHPDLAADWAALKTRIEQVGRTAVANALAEQAVAEMERFAAGLRAYQSHPWHYEPGPRTVLAEAGSARLYCYGQTGAPVMLVPSLVNGSEVLDLLPDRSLARSLKAAGFMPLLLDWGRPEAEELGFNVDAYITERLVPLLEEAAQQTGNPVNLVGYCMGGLLALAAAHLAPETVRSLSLMAMPWDFAQSPALARLSRNVEIYGPTPVAEDQLQALFVALDPALTLDKFCRFAQLDPQSQAAVRFVALESWVNGGAPLAAPAATQVVQDWYQENRPIKGKWRIKGHIITPVPDKPLLFILPRQDRIVPRACAVAAVSDGAMVLEPAAGHVGMVVGSKAHAYVHQPLSQWLLDLDGKCPMSAALE